MAADKDGQADVREHIAFQKVAFGKAAAGRTFAQGEQVVNDFQG